MNFFPIMLCTKRVICTTKMPAPTPAMARRRRNRLSATKTLTRNANDERIALPPSSFNGVVEEGYHSIYRRDRNPELAEQFAVQPCRQAIHRPLRSHTFLSERVWGRAARTRISRYAYSASWPRTILGVSPCSTTFSNAVPRSAIRCCGAHQTFPSRRRTRCRRKWSSEIWRPQ